MHLQSDLELWNIAYAMLNVHTSSKAYLMFSQKTISENLEYRVNHHDFDDRAP